ncbi:MAG: hypothetical protein NT084_15650 [Bacteroidetes bacterium]|nr:hypothetical protein [Bacteroidota bacterium]
MKSVIVFVFVLNSLFSFAQVAAKKDSTVTGPEGISVSPSSLKLSIPPGKSETKNIRISNSTSKSFKFKVSFTDFMMDKNGKPIEEKGVKNKYCLSKWIVVSPSFFELSAGESKEISVRIDVPLNDSSAHAAWTILMLDQVAERQPAPENPNGTSIAMGLVPSFAFGVYIYQNPPNVITNKSEISKFVKIKGDSSEAFDVQVKNTGDGIGFCKLHIEVTSLTDGKEYKLPLKKFTILPGAIRTFDCPLPKGLVKGKYSAVAVLDYGSKEVIEGAEIEFSIE